MSIIAFPGISGCGKTTLSKLLAQHLNAVCCNEPEEPQWPEIITNKYYDQASALLAFRQLWAQQFTNAYILHQQHANVIVDNYFFKIYGYYLGKAHMEWLMPSNSPYLPLLKQLNALDRIYFCDADYVILITVTLDNWKLFLQSRGREWDKTPGFEEAFATTQQYVIDATRDHCASKNVPIIQFEHSFGNIEHQIHKLKELLIFC